MEKKIEAVYVAAIKDFDSLSAQLNATRPRTEEFYGTLCSIESVRSGVAAFARDNAESIAMMSATKRSILADKLINEHGYNGQLEPLIILLKPNNPDKER